MNIADSKLKSIRPFIGAKDFDISRNFYLALGFDEVKLDDKMSLFENGEIGFYLQNAFVQDWVDNTMIFVEVEDVQMFYDELVGRDFVTKFAGARLTPPKKFDWGTECYVHDPSGILWHFGEFHKPN